MATREEIIEVIDALLENRMTPEEAERWAWEEIHKTSHCEDPAFALATLVGITEPKVQESYPWQEALPRDREVLIRRAPCPYDDLGNAIQAYWLGYAPILRFVLVQIRRTEKERILELIEENWKGERIYYHRVPLPLEEEEGPPLTYQEIKEKREAYKKRAITREEALQWILRQLQRKAAIDEYHVLLGFYWRLRRPNQPFTLGYIDAETETKAQMMEISRIAEELRKIWRRQSKKSKNENGEAAREAATK
jgi:hypothetical protein